jgi:hypothetical protein
MSAFEGKADMALRRKMPANDPKRISGHGAKAKIYIQLSIAVNCPEGATCTVEANSR